VTRTVRSALATAGSFDRAAAAVAAALLVLLAGSTLAVAAPIGPQAAPPTVLTLQLAVDVSAAARFAQAPSEDAFARAQPKSTFTLVVPRPRLDASVRAVLAAAPTSAAQHQAMADAFAATGMFDNASGDSLDALRTELTDTEVVFRGSFKSAYPWTIEPGSACQIRLDNRAVTRSTVPAVGEVRELRAVRFARASSTQRTTPARAPFRFLGSETSPGGRCEVRGAWGMASQKQGSERRPGPAERARLPGCPEHRQRTLTEPRHLSLKVTHGLLRPWRGGRRVL